MIRSWKVVIQRVVALLKRLFNFEGLLDDLPVMQEMMKPHHQLEIIKQQNQNKGVDIEAYYRFER